MFAYFCPSLSIEPNFPLRQGGEPIYCHGPHKWWITASGPQKQLI